MSIVERGPADVFEVTWRTGTIDRVLAHQVSHSGGRSLFTDSTEPARVAFHAEVDGRWRLMLSALADDILAIRNLTHVQDAPMTPEARERGNAAKDAS